MTPLENKSFLKALDNFEAKSKSLKTGKTAQAPDVCATYRLAKPVLDGILPFLAFLPGIGYRVAAVLRALMAALDVLCPK